MFKRTVSIDGVLYRQHEVYSIEHLCKKAAEASTFVKVKSTAGTESKSTRHELPLDVGMTFENAEETIMALPFFSEVEDPYADVVASLEEQAQQQASIIGELESQAEQQSAIIGELEGQAQQQSAIIGELEGQAEQQSALIDEISGMLDDDEAITVPQAFREWAPDTAYNVGDRRRHADKLYKCLQPHTSQADQTPDVAVSLWALIIASDDPSKPLPWVQPDSTNGYSIGDRVTHNDQVWESDYDNNVWEPGVFGWHVVEAV